MSFIKILLIGGGGGGSFGASPLRQEIGIGRAKTIDNIEIRWAGSNTVQHFKNLIPNQFLTLTEGDNQPVINHLAKLTFKNTKKTQMSMPMADLGSK